MADQNRSRTTRGAHALECGIDLPAESTMEQQIFGRIAGEREFRKCHDVRTGLRGARGERDHAIGVAADVAD